MRRVKTRDSHGESGNEEKEFKESYACPMIAVNDFSKDI